MKKKVVLISLVVALCAFLCLGYKYIFTDLDKISVYDISKLNDKLCLFVENSNLTNNGIIHRLKYGTSSKSIGKINAVNKQGDVSTLVSVNNGVIKDYYISGTQMFVLYYTGKEMYKNTYRGSNVMIVDLDTSSIVDEFIEETRIIGFDGEKLIYKTDIPELNSLYSNVCYFDNKLYYMDNTKFYQFDINNNEKKVLFEFPRQYTYIDVSVDSDRTFLMCSGGFKSTELYIFNQ